MTTSTSAAHHPLLTKADPVRSTQPTTRRGLLVGLLTRSDGTPAALVTLPDGRCAVTTALSGPQALQVEQVVAGRLRPPTTETGRQLVRWLERPLTQS